MNKSKIARTLGCHRNTVLKVLKRERVIEKLTRQTQSALDPYKTIIKEWLDQKITRLRISEKLREECKFYCTYANLCIYINKHFPKFKEAFGVQITAPGEVAELDFGYLGLLPGAGGGLVKTWGLVVVLAYSRKAYYALTHDQKLQTLIREITNAFLYFKGVPKNLKIDNIRTAILENQHYDLQFNQDFLEFTNHYKTVVIPCTPYSPEQKGKVESGVKYMQINFINGREFADEADLRAKLKDWMDNYANMRVHGTTRKVPSEVFDRDEKQALQPMPDTAFAFFDRSIRKVKPNCHINFENHYYSVPFSYVGREVTVRWNDGLVRIVSEGEQVALHLKATGEGNYVTVRNHLPDYKVYSKSERQVKYETKMRNIGEDAHEYFRWLLAQKEGYWFVIVRGILGLVQTYGGPAVNLTLKRALFYQVRGVGTIRHILEKKLYMLETEPRLLDAERTIFICEDNPFSRDLSYYLIRP